jgi:hypothetical protein
MHGSSVSERRTLSWGPKINEMCWGYRERKKTVHPQVAAITDETCCLNTSNKQRIHGQKPSLDVASDGTVKRVSKLRGAQPTGDGTKLSLVRGQGPTRSTIHTKRKPLNHEP